MKKKYSQSKKPLMLSGILAFWFSSSAIIIIQNPAANNRGKLFLILLASLSLLIFLRIWRLEICSDETYLYFRTFFRNIIIPWGNITEIKTKRGRSGLYYTLSGKSIKRKQHTINLGLIRNKKELLRDIKEKNPLLPLQIQQESS